MNELSCTMHKLVIFQAYCQVIYTSDALTSIQKNVYCKIQTDTFPNNTRAYYFNAFTVRIGFSKWSTKIEHSSPYTEESRFRVQSIGREDFRMKFECLVVTDPTNPGLFTA